MTHPLGCRHRTIGERIQFIRDEEHEWLAIMAIRRRDHPAWSRMKCSYRVAA
jgi:hypothetical protein